MSTTEVQSEAQPEAPEPQRKSSGNGRRGRRAGEILAQSFDLDASGNLVIHTNAGDKTIKFARESLIVELALASREGARTYLGELGL